jgi:hypothetical protein
VFKFFFEKVLGLFNIPEAAVKYFKLSNKLSGLNKSNLPVELIPLNITQLSRGMLNYTFFQHYPDWKFPFWAVKQYDPNNVSFIPRSHLGVSVNVTNRNWTAIGNMNCDVEPIVDPSGSVMPFKDGWTIETWLVQLGKIIIPAYERTLEQKLEDDLPIVKTIMNYSDFVLTSTAYTSDENLICKYSVENISHDKIELDIIVAIRPFNPEGVSIVKKLIYNADEKSFLINDSEKIYLSQQPDKIILSNLKNGDSANLFLHQNSPFYADEIECEYGFANGLAVYNCVIDPLKKQEVTAYVRLDKKKFDFIALKSKTKIKEDWNHLISEGISVNTPDAKLNSLIRASIYSSLQFCDSDILTPGPFIYHQFWFRDAAYQLNALNKFGFNEVVDRIVRNFSKYQKRDGYYQSQKGEWDSNGQVLWMIMQHALLSNNIEVLKIFFNDLFKAVKWIDKKRLTSKKYSTEYYYGLLPKGLSAEHLGLADYYYWDNFWSLAGIKSFILICELLKENSAKVFAEKLYSDYSNTLKKLLSTKNNSVDPDVFASAPNKFLDSGMVGTMSAIYPLQILEFDKGIFDSSLQYIKEHYFYKKLFFQNIIHSGGNPYITLQIAHSYLYLGDREIFYNILNDVIEYASPTLNFPEAIHPLTCGGVIGDGHHGWAAAEILSAIRDAYVFEKNYYSIESIELILLSGIPRKWFLKGNELNITNAPLLSGTISITTIYKIDQIKIDIIYTSNNIYKNEIFKIILPFKVKSINQIPENGLISINSSESLLSVKAASMNLVFDL